LDDGLWDHQRPKRGGLSQALTLTGNRTGAE